MSLTISSYAESVAYRAGRAAQRQGERLRDNPYSEAPLLHAWRKGWLSSDAERRSR